MTDLTPNHPAVEAAAIEIYARDAPGNDPYKWPQTRTGEAEYYRGTAQRALHASLPHLTADDLHHIPAVADLIAKVERVETLADRLDVEDDALRDFYGWEHPRDNERPKAPSTRIRAALDGGDA